MGRFNLVSAATLMQRAAGAAPRHVIQG
eukprot:COSAG06_NODE_50056_length_321_cov_0.698198_2_plen_27_part_01